jgi:tape measure domain-containing protein
MIVRELITKLGFALDRSQLSNAEKGVNNLKNSANGAAIAFRNMAGALAGVLSIKSIIAVADEMQSLRARIAQLPQTVGDAGAAFDVIADRANNAKQSVSAYATFYVKAGNATQDYIKDQTELLKVVDGAAFGLAASGATAVAQSQAFFQLGQAIGSPVVQMEEMNTLIDAAPDLFRELGKVIPGAEGNLKKFVSTGQVTGRMLAEGLVKAAATFEQKMKTIPLTVGQAMVIVGNKFGLLIDRMNRKSLFITNIANAILSGFDMIEAGLLKLEKAFGGWDNAIRLVGITLGVAFGVKAIQILAAFRLATLAALAPWALMAAAIAGVALLIEDLYVWIQGGDSITGDLIGPWTEWRAYVIGAIDTVMGVLKWFKELLEGIWLLIKGVFSFDGTVFVAGLTKLGNLMADTIVSWGKLLYDTYFSSIGNAIKDAWSSAIGSVGSFLKPAAELLMQGSPHQMMGAGTMGSGRANVSNSTNVTVTVPPGTTDQQVSFIQNAAQQSFAKAGDNKLARDLATYAP